MGLRYRLGGGNIATLARPKCAQLFFVYTGFAGMPGMPPMTFLAHSGLGRRNIVIIRDPYNVNFVRGVSPDIPDLDALLQWHRTYRNSLEGIRETYCLGNSAGGSAALMFGCALGVKRVFAFAPRLGTRPRARREPGQIKVSALVDLLKTGNGVTQYDIFCSPASRGDRTFAEYFAECPGVSIHYIEAAQAARGWKGHMIMQTMASTGRLAEIFPDFLPA